MRVILLLAILFSSQLLQAGVLLKPSNEVFRYVGRFDFSNPYQPRFAHSGCQIEFLFKGDELKFGVRDVVVNGGAENKNYFTVIINGEERQVLASTLGIKYHKIAVNSPDSFALIQVFKRTEASCAVAHFNGVKFEKGEFKRPDEKGRKIEWIGDSFMAGYGNLVSIAPPPSGNPSTGFHAENEDGYNAFGAISSRKLNADYSSVVYSGHGVYRNFDTSEDFTLPEIYPYIFPKEDGAKTYDFSFKPDLIVIKIGTNDFGAEMRKPPVMADSSRFVSTYISFLKTVVAKNPNAKIVLAVGGGITDYFPVGLQRLTRFRNWMQVVKLNFEKESKLKLGFFEFQVQQPPYGEDWHPTLKSQQKFAEEITPYLKKFMRW